MITWLRMPLSNINMPHPLLSWLVITVLFHCRASSPAQYALTNHVVPPPTYAMTSPGLNISRDYISLFITQCLGLSTMYSHPTLSLSVHYALNQCYRAQKPALFTLCSERARRPVRIVFSRTLILLLLCSSGVLDFGDVIFKIASNTLLSKLDVVYHSAIRFVTKAPHTTPHCDLYALVGWPWLHINRQTNWLQVIYRRDWCTSQNRWRHEERKLSGYIEVTSQDVSHEVKACLQMVLQNVQ